MWGRLLPLWDFFTFFLSLRAGMIREGKRFSFCARYTLYTKYKHRKTVNSISYLLLAFQIHLHHALLFPSVLRADILIPPP